MPKAGAYEYPKYDLEHVLEKLTRLYDVTKTYELDRSVVAESLGMSERGGGFANLIASMEKYGLIETGKGNVVITDLGKIILFGDTAEIEQAKSKAVMGIELFKEVYVQYGDEVTTEQIKAFLRYKAHVEIARAQKIAPKVAKIYKKVSNYIVHAEQPSATPAPTPTSITSTSMEGIGRRENMTSDTENQPLKIQYKGVYIQIPPNDVKAIELAEKALAFMKKEFRESTKNSEENDSEKG